MRSVVKTYYCPAGANYATDVGKIVYCSAAGEATLITDGDAVGQKPLGIIVRCDGTENGAAVAVCVEGECHVLLTADHGFLLGTEHFSPSNAGLGDDVAAGYWIVGRLSGNSAPAASELYPCIVGIENEVAA